MSHGDQYPKVKSNGGKKKMQSVQNQVIMLAIFKCKKIY